ncbi:hypothetical protein LTR17_000970 [Elasticomyces elasticus]|nr:hypothetical protein LTR17_000970 [Elasticomyces elasticus]
MADSEINCYYASMPLDHERKETRLLTVEPGDWQEEIHCSLRNVSLLAYANVLEHDTASAFRRSALPSRVFDSLAQYMEDWTQHPEHHGEESQRLSDNLDEAWQNLEAPADTFEMPVFEALSYVWGYPMLAMKIYLQGLGALSVTHNLHDALRRLRRRDRERCLWIDALCVNQSDPLERASQVLLMKQIYSTAHRVVVWLGEPQGHSSLVPSDMPRPRHPLGGHDLSISYEEYWSVKYEEYWSTARTRKTVLDAFLERTNGLWWTRMWVLQELVNSRREPRVVYGAHVMLWDKFLEVAISRNDKALTRAHHKFSALHMMAASRDGRRWLADTVSSLLVLSVATEQLAATDERDKLYALFGLLQEQHAMLFKVDYTITPGRAFTDATTVLINTSRSLAPLNFVRPNERPRLDLSSWAIDFAPNVVENRPDVDRFLMRDFMKMLKFTAAAGTDVNMGDVTPRIIPGHSPILQICGVLIDTVNATATFGGIGEDLRLQTLLDSLPTGLSRRRKNTPHGDDDKYTRVLWTNLRTAFEDFSATRTEADRRPTHDATETLFKAWASDVGITQDQRVEDRYRWRSLDELLRFRGANLVMFTTQRGYLGCSSDGICTGDAIVEAERNMSPLLLRYSHPDAVYTFRGVVFLSKRRTPPREPETFSIR